MKTIQKRDARGRSCSLRRAHHRCMHRDRSGGGPAGRRADRAGSPDLRPERRIPLARRRAGGSRSGNTGRPTCSTSTPPVTWPRSGRCLTPAEFATMKPGMTRDEVLALIGHPVDTFPIGRQKVQVWSYRYPPPEGDCTLWQVSIRQRRRRRHGGSGRAWTRPATARTGIDDRPARAASRLNAPRRRAVAAARRQDAAVPVVVDLDRGIDA